MSELISIRWQDGTVEELRVEERVFPDRSCGQYEGGWLAFRPGQEDDENAPAYFISDEGTVYAEGTSDAIGVSPKLREAMDKLEALMASEPES